jgi:CRP-like cAMP-binding protein
MKRNVLNRLYEGRLRGPNVARKILQNLKQPKRHNQEPTYIKGVSNGNFFRVKIPPTKALPRIMPKLPLSHPMPKPLTSVITVLAAEAGAKGQVEFFKRFMEWLKANLPVIALNISSVCTLVAFTRSDVIELRALTMTGSILFIGYGLGHTPKLWPPIAWSVLFVAVNGAKLLEILQERNAEVHMSTEQQKVYVEHLLPHGITPKQFERIEKNAEIVKLKKGEVLVRQGDDLESVYLIRDGSTHAHAFGRHLTAASTTPETKGDQKEGGDSGSWVGEMALLNYMGEKEQDKTNPAQVQIKRSVGKAIYTIVAEEDCSVMKWSHEDMEGLMDSSNDMRSALTRAMTTALVGKVINMTVSRSTTMQLPSWTNWLSDWKYSDGARVQVQETQKLPEECDLQEG